MFKLFTRECCTLRHNCSSYGTSASGSNKGRAIPRHIEVPRPRRDRDIWRHRSRRDETRPRHFKNHVSRPRHSSGDHIPVSRLYQGTQARLYFRFVCCRSSIPLRCSPGTYVWHQDIRTSLPYLFILKCVSRLSSTSGTKMLKDSGSSRWNCSGIIVSYAFSADTVVSISDCICSVWKCDARLLVHCPDKCLNCLYASAAF